MAESFFIQKGNFGFNLEDVSRWRVSQLLLGGDLQNDRKHIEIHFKDGNKITIIDDSKDFVLIETLLNCLENK